MGGVGKGATTAACIKAVMLAQKYPNNVGLIGRKTFPLLRDTVLKVFHRLFPPDASPGMRWRGGDDMKYQFDNGSEILFRHLDEYKEGVELGFAYVDQAEELPEDIFWMLDRRVRLPSAGHRVIFLTGNPAGHDWIWRLFKANNDPRFHLVEAATDVNAANLTPDYLKSLEQMPEKWRKRYVYGSWDDFGGQVYPFSTQIHLIPSIMIPREWPQIAAIDTAVSGFTAALFMAVTPTGDRIVFEEYKREGGTVKEHAAALKLLAAKYRILYWLIDPAAAARTQQRGGRIFSLKDEYATEGIYTRCANNDVEVGINKVLTLMAVDPTHTHPLTQKTGAPRLFVCEHLRETMNEFAQYSWKQLRPGSEQRSVPRKVNDHLMDCLRYLAMETPHIALSGSPKIRQRNPYTEPVRL